jgi:hypothetical protein
MPAQLALSSVLIVNGVFMLVKHPQLLNESRTNWLCFKRFSSLSPPKCCSSLLSPMAERLQMCHCACLLTKRGLLPFVCVFASLKFAPTHKEGTTSAATAVICQYLVSCYTYPRATLPRLLKVNRSSPRIRLCSLSPAHCSPRLRVAGCSYNVPLSVVALDRHN